MRAVFAAAAMLAIAGAAHAGSREVQYGPSPSWVTPPPKSTDGASPAGAPLRFAYLDQQARLRPDGEERYTAFRVKILSPEGLAAGNLVSTWNPEGDDLTVHAVRIIRGGQVIDVLKASKFRVVEREDQLDAAVLNGNLVAHLQTPGLQVGDELEFSATIHRRDTVFNNRARGIQQLPTTGTPGVFRVRVVWPDAIKLRWKTTPDLAPAAPQEHQGQHELVYELRDPASSIGAEGAPVRYNFRRAIEFSQFSSWAEVSNAFWPLFQAAATPKPGSAVALEADKIAKATSDPKARAEAALRLVQEQIRYVYVGLDGGAYRPATADETWARRFGDCKAKTVLLLALLHRLGVSGEAVLVNTGGGDGTNERLPMPAHFNHVLVRATIEGKPYWLDGTHSGELRLADVAAPKFRWALPVRPGAVELEAVPAVAPLLPELTEMLDLDVSGGAKNPAKVRLEQVHRGEQARTFKRELSPLSREDAERALKSYFREANAWLQPKTVAWRFDEYQQALILTVTGEGKLEWEGDDLNGRSLDVFGAGFTPPDELKRPEEQDQTAPWTTSFPRYKRWTTVIRLPPARDGWRWSYRDAPVHRRLGGVSYWREAEMKDGVVRSTMSRRSYAPEISAAEAHDLNAQLPGFDNKISRVFEVKSQPGEHPAPAPVDVADQVQNLTAQRRLAAAQEAVQAGHLAEALSAIDEARALEPESAAILEARADALHRLGRHEEALADLEEARRINPLDPAIAISRTRELVDVGRPETKAP